MLDLEFGRMDGLEPLGQLGALKAQTLKDHIASPPVMPLNGQHFSQPSPEVADM